jgi:hypothetical protein
MAFAWLGILVATIILILTVNWANITDLAQLLLFGLTLSSLVLAVIAIFQSLFSQASFGQTASKMTDAAEAVQAAITKIETASTNLLQQTESIPGALGEISTRFDRFQERFVNATGTGEAKEQAKIAESPPKPGLRRVTDITLGGTFAYYLCLESIEKKVAFDATKAIKNIVTARYVQCFIAALRSSQTFQIEKNEKDEFRVVGTGDIDVENLASVLSIRLPKKSSEKIKEEIDIYIAARLAERAVT